MIQPTGYEAKCDHPHGCGQVIRRASYWGENGLFEVMDARGWQRGVKLNGERARRGGKDYCRKHRVGES